MVCVLPVLRGLAVLAFWGKVSSVEFLYACFGVRCSEDREEASTACDEGDKEKECWPPFLICEVWETYVLWPGAWREPCSASALRTLPDVTEMNGMHLPLQGASHVLQGKERKKRELSSCQSPSMVPWSLSCSTGDVST